MEASASLQRESPVPPAKAWLRPLSPAARERLTRWAWIFGIWTVLGLLSLFDLLFGRFSDTNPDLARRFTLGGMLNTWLWALGTPGMMWLARRFPLERGRWGRHLALHILIGCALSTLSSVVNVFLLAWLVPEFPRRFLRLVVDESALNLVSYFAVVAACHTIDAYRLWNERRLRAAQLETQLVQARFEALEAQLRPHFLFSSLENIAALVRAGENQSAVRMISGVGDLLRMVLRREGAQKIPLGQELDFAERYLGLEQLRLRDRLEVHVDADPGTLDALVPSLVLQPLVENAIRHGVEAAPAGAPVEVELRAERAGDTLALTVRDTGAGRTDTGATEREGALASTRARLEHLYGAQCRLELSRSPGGATVASLLLPFQPASEQMP